jgi:hypothetical protein
MSAIVRFEGDQSAAVRAYLARILWLQGLPDQAMRTAESSVRDARATNHAIALGLALALAACPIALWVGDLTWKCCSTIQQGMRWRAGAPLAFAIRECSPSTAAISAPD